MNFIKSLSAIIIIAAAGISCSSPVYVQKDDASNLSGSRTYMWVETRANEQDSATRSTAYMDISVHNAVNNELAKKGWRQVNDNPDILLSYDILVERSTESQSDPVYSRSMTRMYYNPYRRRWGTIYYPSQFLGYQYYTVPVKEGTVTLTMTDATSDKAVWQGWTTERLNNSRITNEEISKSVKNILKKFNANA